MLNSIVLGITIDGELIYGNSRYNNNKINTLHEGALRIVYVDYKSCFEQLLGKDQLNIVW